MKIAPVQSATFRFWKKCGYCGGPVIRSRRYHYHCEQAIKYNTQRYEKKGQDYFEGQKDDPTLPQSSRRFGGLGWEHYDGLD